MMIDERDDFTTTINASPPPRVTHPQSPSSSPLTDNSRGHGRTISLGATEAVSRRTASSLVPEGQSLKRSGL